MTLIRGYDMLRKLIHTWKRLTMSEAPSSENQEMASPKQELCSLHEIDFQSIYPALKQIAQRHMNFERGDHTLQPTALIHELYLQLLQRPDFRWTDRNHFLFYASRAMRHLLVDHAKAHRAAKRHPGEIRLDISFAADPAVPSLADILDVDRALDDLAKVDPRKARVVELRIFGGLSFPEISAALSISDRTAKRDLALAEEWLKARLSGGKSGTGRVGGN